jgi:hypothetical protein
MDGEPITVTNENGRDAPPDLVVLDVLPDKISIPQRNKILDMDWYTPDPKLHEGFDDVVLVRWRPLNIIVPGHRPLAPAEVGLDNLKAVVLTETHKHQARTCVFYTQTE